jgi:hypothetical protein
MQSTISCGAQSRAFVLGVAVLGACTTVDTAASAVAEAIPLDQDLEIEGAVASSQAGELSSLAVTSVPGATALDKAFAALGGRAAVQRLATLTYRVATTRSVLAENFEAIEGATPIGEISSLVRYDLAGDRVRTDIAQHFTYGGNDSHLTFSITLSGGFGQVDGIENVFFSPTGRLAASGVGSERRELFLLNPGLALHVVALDPTRATDLGPIRAGAHTLGRVRIADPAQPVVLYIDDRSGLVLAMSTIDDSPLFKDRRTISIFGWSPGAGHSLAAPSYAALRTGGSWVITERRSDIVENARLDDALFAIQPDGPAADPIEQARGSVDREYQVDLARLSFRLDALQLFIKPIEVAPGVWFVTGASHNAVVVEQRDGLVVLEAPLYEERSQALLAWTRSQFPGKRVTHVVPTHHHEDHAGGLRAFVADGATVVVHDRARALYERAFRAAATVRPDALSRSPRTARFAVLRDGALILPDATARWRSTRSPTTTRRTWSQAICPTSA